MKPTMNFSKFSRELGLSRMRLTPFMDAGIVDPWSEADLEKVKQARAKLEAMEEISVETLKDPLNQLAFLSSDEMPFEAKWMSAEFCTAHFGISRASAEKLFISGVIPHFMTIQGSRRTTLATVLKVADELKATSTAHKVSNLIKKKNGGREQELLAEIKRLEDLVAELKSGAKPAPFVDKDEAWDAGIGKKREELVKAKAFTKPAPIQDDDDDYVPPTPEQEAATLKMLQERAKASFEEAEIARSKAAAAAKAKELEGLTPEEIAAKKKADDEENRKRVFAQMNRAVR
jgi:hypothetical protein